MNTLKNKGLVALFGALALVACGETDVADLALDDLTVDEQSELEVLTDPGSFEIALELAETTADVASGMGGTGAAAGRGLTAQARMRFADARALMLAGDRRAALLAARQARRMVAEAMREMGGDASLEALIERIEALATTAEDDVFDNADAVRAALERIAAEARALLAQGDSLAAAARAILGEQMARHHRGRRDHPDIDVDRARLAVSLAQTAVRLAERLIADDAVPVVSAADTNVSDRQNRWLAHAHRLLEKAEAALANGYRRRAVHLAQHASWSALKAVILPGGIHAEEIRAMVQLAERLLDEAEASLGEDATELQLRLLGHAGALLERGIARLQEGHVRGIAAVWRSAVVSAWLIG